MEELKKRLDPTAAHARTGCVLHTSYWPAKLLWLAAERKEAFAATARWLSFGEYLYERVCGRPALSSSMASGSGIWNQNSQRLRRETLAVLPVRREQLFPRPELDQAPNRLSDEFKAKWPLFDGIPWFPAVGDGACNNIGSGCITPDRFSLMVGTSGAMRAVLEEDGSRFRPGSGATAWTRGVSCWAGRSRTAARCSPGCGGPWRCPSGTDRAGDRRDGAREHTG